MASISSVVGDRKPASSALLVFLCVATLSCQSRDGATAQRTSAPSARELVLAARDGDHPLDQRIRMLQGRVASSKVPAAELERLGWTFIARARELSDPGAYQMALQCALAIEELERTSHAALLLRGHALHSLHRFAEAEQVARRLVEERGLAFDLGLLGDVLADRGRLGQATEAYQRMVDMRPDMHSYARAGHVRYLQGDLEGALEAMTMAARAASPRNPESFAWTWSKLALYQLQAGAIALALDSVERALAVFPESPAALKLQGAIWLYQGKPEQAIVALRAAAKHTPHPEVLWLLIETADALGRTQEATALRARMREVGATEDGRAFAMYLATEGKDLALAEQLVRKEFAERSDVYSYEALAWVQSAKGEHAAALDSARRSLAAGTADPRLYYHAGLIAERAGDRDAAREWLEKASAAPAALLPSQRVALAAHTQALGPHEVTDRHAFARAGRADNTSSNKEGTR